MFDLIFGKSKQYCDHVTRRQSLTMGSSTILGGLSLPAILQLQSLASENQAARAKSCIFIMLEGGPSHIDMWDLKPQATKEIRGLFQPISTIVPGTQISEILPLCAQITDKMAIMRSHSHRDNGHQTGRHRVLTGYPPSFGDGQAPGMPFNALYPSIGSVISRELGIQGAVPPYIEMPNPLGPGGPGFYGPTYAPFTIETDPVEPDFSVRDLSVANGIDDRRFTLRRKLLQGAERLSPTRQTSKRAKTMSTYYKKALELATSETAKKAFHIQSEPDQVRQRYGLHSLGQCALLSRRLVEAGCRFVGIEHGSWDTHVDNFTGHAKALVPPADQALSALITDLDQKGLLDETLIVMMGEMGRTPRINNDAGRDHWSQCQSVIFAGGGTQPGIVIGSSDKNASYPTSDPYGIQDLLRTIYHLLGIDADKIHHTPLGRPVPIVNGGKIITELLA